MHTHPPTRKTPNDQIPFPFFRIATMHTIYLRYHAQVGSGRSVEGNMLPSQVVDSQTLPSHVATRPHPTDPNPTRPETTCPNPIRPNTDPTDRGPTQPDHNSTRRRPDPTRSDPTPTRPTYLSVGSVLGRIGLGQVVSVSSCGWVGSGLCRIRVWSVGLGSRRVGSTQPDSTPN